MQEHGEEKLWRQDYNQLLKHKENLKYIFKSEKESLILIRAEL